MKVIKTAIVIILGITMATGIACGNKTASPTPTPTPTPTKTTINVNESDSGGEVALGHSEFLIVTLVSNPSTGYSWNLSAISNTSVVQYWSDEYIAPEQTTPPMVGAPGHEVWTFEALDAGTATISMKYIRPWETGAEPAETFEITVDVE